MNQNLDEKKARFQSVNTSTRLGHIASNLARIRTFCNSTYKEAVESLAEETTWFIEWTAAEIEPEYAEELVNIQVQLARWKLTLDSIWSNDSERKKISEQSNAWSERVLDMSGLVSESIA
ncbi:hypothetical protein H6G76_07110 [Nostoc sp. FACHB-152]|uniref:hypothetical protein n=1 Tax=unclassified Nostoc TaxID=2593658 RepID=UPI0016844799|nr:MULTISPECIES: hypothetical protein [unclassified Nostoc]MBD2446936.1 hypothetical protein [Nostoc sp. FACHB-152]MBD2467726.1 hypothetical protein [Nostoc sp. FACHB-145]